MVRESEGEGGKQRDRLRESERGKTEAQLDREKGKQR